MKKNLLGLIGSGLGFIALFFLNLPLLSISVRNVILGGSDTTILPISTLMFSSRFDIYLKGISGKTVECSTAITGQLIIVSILMALICLILSIRGMVEKKNYGGTVLALSAVNVLTVYSVLVLLSWYKNSSTYSIKWGE